MEQHIHNTHASSFFRQYNYIWCTLCVEQRVKNKFQECITSKVTPKLNRNVKVFCKFPQTCYISFGEFPFQVTILLTHSQNLFLSLNQTFGMLEIQEKNASSKKLVWNDPCYFGEWKGCAWHHTNLELQVKENPGFATKESDQTVHCNL